MVLVALGSLRRMPPPLSLPSRRPAFSQVESVRRATSGYRRGSRHRRSWRAPRAVDNAFAAAGERPVCVAVPATNVLPHLSGQSRPANAPISCSCRSRRQTCARRLLRHPQAAPTLAAVSNRGPGPAADDRAGNLPGPAGRGRAVASPQHRAAHRGCGTVVVARRGDAAEAECEYDDGPGLGRQKGTAAPGTCSKGVTCEVPPCWPGSSRLGGSRERGRCVGRPCKYCEEVRRYAVALVLKRRRDAS